MKIKVKKNISNTQRGPIVLIAIMPDKKFIKSVELGSEFDIEDSIGNKLLGAYSEILEVVSYGAPKTRMVESMETK